MERVSGVSEFALMTDDAQRDSVARDYFFNMAMLHKLAPSELPLEGIEVPTTADVAFGRYRHKNADYIASLPKLWQSEPLLEFGRWWSAPTCRRWIARSHWSRATPGPANSGTTLAASPH
jgi:hypothetical protein